jgi:hypothetical protein
MLPSLFVRKKRGKSKRGPDYDSRRLIDGPMQRLARIGALVDEFFPARCERRVKAVEFAEDQRISFLTLTTVVFLGFGLPPRPIARALEMAQSERDQADGGHNDGDKDEAASRV